MFQDHKQQGAAMLPEDLERMPRDERGRVRAGHCRVCFSSVLSAFHDGIDVILDPEPLSLTQSSAAYLADKALFRVKPYHRAFVLHWCNPVLLRLDLIDAARGGPVPQLFVEHECYGRRRSEAVRKKRDDVRGLVLPDIEPPF